MDIDGMELLSKWFEDAVQKGIATHRGYTLATIDDSFEEISINRKDKLQLDKKIKK